MENKKNEIMATEPETNALASPMEDMGGLMDELEGLGTLTLERIKIPSGGGVAFEVPGENPDDPDMVKALEGVIVHHQPKNVYYKDAYTGAGEGGNRPDCSSVDGKTGIMDGSGTERNCKSCRYNQFGSGNDGVGKACQNRVDLYILMDGDTFPKVLSLPATSLKDFKTYLAMRVVSKKKRLSEVRTKIQLKKAQSKSGIAYSSCVFSKIGDVEAEQMPEIKEMKEFCKSVAMSYGAEAVTEEGFEEITGDDEALPFD